MAVKRVDSSHSGDTSTSRGGVLIQLNLIGLLVFSAALVVASVLVTRGMLADRSVADLKPASVPSVEMTAPGNSSRVRDESNPPAWGQLFTANIELEQPEEYLGYELATNRVETWTFEGMTPGDVRSLLQSSGLAAGEINRALSPPLLTRADSNTVVVPDARLVFALTPETRAKVYAVLGHSRSNRLMQSPFILVGSSADTRFAGSGLSEPVLNSLRNLFYPRGRSECFSDLEIMLQQLPTEKERWLLLKALSRQSAVLARLHVWPDTDIDKLIGYWGRGVQAKDLRPLLESLTRIPGGASISLLYFLPQFARQRLYTYPEPSQPNDPVMDCHWSTLNFFNEVPDNRFSDPAYAILYLQNNCYKIAQPGAYGDMIFLLDQHGSAIHSAVYLADDLVFTKNGNNFAQPWMLMHLDDLVAKYTTDTAPQLAVYRNKNW